MKIHISFFLLPCLLIFLSCSKDSPIDQEEPVFLVSGGSNKYNIEEFSIQLDAELDSAQVGQWTILSGLVDDKVYFDQQKEPNTIFHGLPGEEYKLEWTVQQSNKTSKDTITVSFAPLKTTIEDISPEFYSTRKHLKAKNYERGIWKVEGDDYRWIWNQNFGGLSIPDEESPNIKFFGYENKSYDLIWETWYGSVSATDTMHVETSEYHQYEALESLFVLGDTYHYKLDEDGNVIELNLGGDAKGNIYDRIDQNPSLKALTHLKRLTLDGDGLHNTPTIISTYYTELEYLDLSGNHFTSLPANFGNLQKLDTLRMDHIQGGHLLKELPESFGNLKSLKFLEMASMGIEKLPESFSQLTNLEYLDLEVNNIEKLPEQFGNLTKLKTFRGPGLFTNLPESFSKLENLEFCFFYLKSSEPELPENFGNLDKLETLWVFGDLHYLPSSFTDLASIKDLEFTGATNLLQELPADLGNLSTLENLRIHGSFTELPESIGNLQNLKNLRISGKLESLPNSISLLANLEYLNVYAMNIASIPEDIGKLKKLKYLILGHNQIQDLPESLGDLESLYKLDVSANKIAYFPETLANLNDSLYELYVGGNDFTEEEFSKLEEMLPNVQISTY